MYIRKIKKKSPHNGKDYFYLHLVENIRTEHGPRQKLILNLGAIDIDPSQYQALAQRIEERLSGTLESRPDKSGQTAEAIRQGVGNYRPDQRKISSHRQAL